jgi:hypothetical protein
LIWEVNLGVVIESCDLKNCLSSGTGRKSRDANASFKIERVDARKSHVIKHTARNLSIHDCNKFICAKKNWWWRIIFGNFGKTYRNLIVEERVFL